MKTPLLSVSMLSADFSNLERDVMFINQSLTDWFHLDIMDGLFVPNISYGFPVVEAIAKLAQKPLDVHLMIVDPDRYINRFQTLGVQYLSVHYETCTHLHRTLQFIRKSNMKAGVAINPHTPVTLLTDVLEEADFVLVMSVNPGFAAQQFIPQTYTKIVQLKEMILKKQLNCLIEVDGGVNLTHAKALVDAGVDILVAGNAIFNAPNPAAAITSLKSTAHTESP